MTFTVDMKIRNEKNQLLLGIRRASRPQTVMPSSVLSSDSMHIGLLAAAAHAAATNSCFTIFYNPRWNINNLWFSILFWFLTFQFHSGLVLRNLWFPFRNMWKLCIIRVFLLGCVFVCCLKLKNQVSAGILISFPIF